MNVDGMKRLKDLHLSFDPKNSVGPCQCDKELDELKKEKTTSEEKMIIYI